MAASFVAQYDGRCPGCGDRILAGMDDIVMVDGLAYHEGCGPIDDEPDLPTFPL